jgi:hypothetical protein
MQNSWAGTSGLRLSRKIETTLPDPRLGRFECERMFLEAPNRRGVLTRNYFGRHGDTMDLFFGVFFCGAQALATGAGQQ